ncbi:hypothetical protein [Lacticaseibacillus porcinae]|uniref:hypothetical protein n=1 Tax=Lacticaseibacillus porcinae TaxID=1123687 RepID=UPI000F7899C6|nr:hypothetical protein [Lacticaseibacillus porcinae]
MTNFETAIVSAVFICGITGIALSVMAIIKRHRVISSDLLIASQVFLYQLVTLLAVMQKSWIYLAIAILCDALLAISILLRAHKKRHPHDSKDSSANFEG